MICKKCGKEIEDGAVACPNCGKKLKKKPLYKKWWFWVAIVLVVIIVSSSGGGNDKSSNTDSSSQTSISSKSEEIVYEKIELQTMIDDLKSNALKAEKTYQKKYVEIEGKITNFDSDGDYISIEPVNADEWNFDTVMCKIKNDDQLNFLLEKNTGDTVTIKGQVTSIGELLGYTVNIAEVL